MNSNYILFSLWKMVINAHQCSIYYITWHILYFQVLHYQEWAVFPAPEAQLVAYFWEYDFLVCVYIFFSFWKYSVSLPRFRKIFFLPSLLGNVTSIKGGLHDNKRNHDFGMRGCVCVLSNNGKCCDLQDNP